MREFTEEEVQEIIYGNSEDFEIVVEELSTAMGRFHEHIDVICECRETGKFYVFYYFHGLTDKQENMFDKQKPQEVEERTETVIQKTWVPVKHEGG